MLRACKEVGRPIFFSLLVIAVAFMPIFSLAAQEGRLFKPLAFTKNFSMFFAAILAITLVPVLIQIFIKPTNPIRMRPKFLSKVVNFFYAGKIHNEEEHPISKFLFRLYDPILTFILKHRVKTIIGAGLIMITVVPVYMRLGSEFMPPLNEGDILYMPTTLPGISIEEARIWLQAQDKIFKSFNEVETVFGKIGRARTATDPAPLSMVETTVRLKPVEEWPDVYHERWYSEKYPEWLKNKLRLIWPEMKPRTWQELISDLDKVMKFPGTTNAWTMPIKTRIDMLTTGIRTPVGIKVYGPDLEKIQKIGEHIEAVLQGLQGTRSVYAERVVGGYFVDFEINRDEIARYGLTVGDVEDVIETAIGGKNITMTIEGRERYPVNVRYARELRNNVEKLERILVATPSKAQVPLGQLAEIKLTMGAPAIKDENGMLTGWVYVDIFEDKDIGSYVREAKELIKHEIELEPGYYLGWSGQFEYMERARKTLLLVLPITLLIIVLLLYINTGSWIKTGIVFLAVPFSLVGAFWILYILGYNMSVAVWVGIIALAGVDAETGVVMLLYLDLSYDDMKKKGKMRGVTDLTEAVMHGAVKRVRPKVMTVGTTFMGLLPIMWSGAHEAGADVMKRIAAPMVGGILTSFIMELLVYPAIFMLWKWHSEVKKNEDQQE